jgi:hypothetical protein
MKAFIYWAKSGGLANRLRALVGYQALSSCLKVPFYLCWIPDMACNIEFARLFNTSEIKLITAAEKQSMEDRHESLVYNANMWFSAIWENHVKNSVSWDYFRKRVVDHTKRLRPLPHIFNILGEFSKLHNLHEAVAVHIRLTDNVDCYERWSKYLPDFFPECISKLEGFERFIADSLRANPATKIFLATDNEDVEKCVSEIFAGHLITYPKRYRKQVKLTFSMQELRLQRQSQRTSSIEDALVEMLLLGRCRIIVGTYWSSYSQFASFWGDTPYLEVRGCQYSESCFMNRIQGKVNN